MKGKKILVAGGTGLVGTNLTRCLVDLGAVVTSSFRTRQPDRLQQYYRRYDFTRFEDCLKATAGREYVFLCAVQASGIQGMKTNPSTPLLPNLQIHAGMLEACAQNHVPKVLWISSSTVYQEAFYPIREVQLDLNQPTCRVYQAMGWFYRYVEQLCRLYHDQLGLKIGILRTTSIYGPYDQFDDQKSHVIPALIKRALNRETPFVVWGNGHTVRDFIYVDDLIDAMLQIVQGELTCEPLNVPDGRPMTVREAVAAILDVAGHAVTPVYDAAKPAAIPYRTLDMTKYMALYGKPKRTPFKEGIRQTMEWYQALKKGAA